MPGSIRRRLAVAVTLVAASATVAATTAVGAFDNAQQAKDAIRSGKAKNVILLIN